MTNGSDTLRAWDLRRAGLLPGLGLGGFFDGIVFHQIFQWHPMLTSAGHPIDSLGNLQHNVFWDGLFHAATYLFTAAGLWTLRQALTLACRPASTRVPAGSMLIGWGVFNLLKGIVDPHLLGIHHVRDDLSPGAVKLAWDLAFLAWGAAMLMAGGWLARAGRPKPSVTVARGGRVRGKTAGAVPPGLRDGVTRRAGKIEPGR